MHASTLKKMYTHQTYILLLAVKDIFLIFKTVKGLMLSTPGGAFILEEKNLTKRGNSLKQTGACELLHVWTRLQRKG